MIIIKAIFEGETARPSEVIDTKFGSNFDGVNFIYFESEQEKSDYYKQFEQPTEETI